MSRVPRASIRYARMVDVIDLIQKRGPQTIDQICKRLKVNEYTFKMDRGSHSGQVALEDYGLTMPRPVASENYTYKLASTYKTGNPDTDGEPNIQHMTGDLLTRTTTLYSDVDMLVGLVSSRVLRMLLQRLQKALELTIVSASDAAAMSGAPVSPRAQHVLDVIFPPPPPVATVP